MMPNVPKEIKTYGDLKNAVSLWMDRDDDEFISQIPNFINFAEKEIYRNVRIPKFEREIYLPIRDGVAYIPADCLEIKYIMFAKSGKVFRTTSLEELDSIKQKGDKIPNPVFAQATGRLYFYPEITAHSNANTAGIVPMLDGTEVIMSYYRDTTELGKDDESNEIMTIAPELMLYTALKHACVFVQDDNGAQKWGALSQATTETIMQQAHNMNFSGSPLVIPQGENAPDHQSLSSGLGVWF